MGYNCKFHNSSFSKQKINWYEGHQRYVLVFIYFILRFNVPYVLQKLGHEGRVINLARR